MAIENSFFKKRGRRIYIRQDISGQLFGNLLVVCYSHDDKNSISVWKCRCKCGKETLVRLSALNAGRISSCGCVNAGNKNRKHPLYHIWQSAKDRCFNKKCYNYKRYGARGIKMCDKWVNNYDAFYEYCIPLYVEGKKIDRINNDGNYEPGNIKWSTPSESVRNRSITKLDEKKVSEIRKSNLTHIELSIKYGVSKQTIATLRTKNCTQWR